MTRTKTVSPQQIKRLFSERKYIAAQTLMDRLIADRGLPSSPGDIYMCARIYRENGEYDKAIACWEQFFTINPENYSQINALNELAVCYSKAHQYEEALKVYDQLLSLSPRDKFALFGKSLVLMRIGQNEDATNTLAEALTHFPNDTRVINQYAKAQQYSGQHNKAITLFRRTLKIEPDNFFAWSGLFISYKQLNEEAMANDVLKNLKSIAGKDIRALDKFIRELYREGELQIAIDFIDTISDIKIEDRGYLRLIADIYMEKGEQTNEIVFHRKALSILQKLEPLYSTPNVTALALIGICYLYLNERGKANECFKNVLDYLKYPIAFSVRRLMHKVGDKLLNVGMTNLAIEYFDALLKDDPDDPYGLDGLGKAFRNLGEYDRSIEIYNRKLALYPNDIYALDGLALVYQEKGESDKTIEVFNRLAAAHEEERNKLQRRISRIRSERIRAEIEQFNERKLSALSTMTSGVSHELSQPLAIIRWNVSSLIRDIDKNRLSSQDLRQVLHKMDYQANRINEILQTFKELSREHPLILREVDLIKTVRRTIDMFGNQLKIRNITVDLSGMRRLVPTILADELRLEQVLMNLILNSRDVLEGRNDGIIECRTFSYGSSDKGRVLLGFTDNGPGIPQDVRARIYDPFFTTKPVGRGTGLGLSIVFQYMQDMRGSIELDETYTKGAKFKLKFRPYVER